LKSKLPNSNHPKAQFLDPSDSSVSLKEWLALLGIDVVEFVEFRVRHNRENVTDLKPLKELALVFAEAKSLDLL
jgi:hypothetical protein